MNADEARIRENIRNLEAIIHEMQGASDHKSHETARELHQKVANLKAELASRGTPW